MQKRLELRTGDRAYFETVRGGLVPCKVEAITDRNGGGLKSEMEIFVRFTATRGLYEKGSLGCTNGLHVIPIGATIRNQYKTMILPYTVFPD